MDNITIKIDNKIYIPNGIFVSATYGRKYEAVWHNSRLYGIKINNPINGFNSYNELYNYIDNLKIN